MAYPDQRQRCFFGRLRRGIPAVLYAVLSCMAGKGRVGKLSVGKVAAVAALLAGEWVLLVAGTTAHEMVVGAFAVVLATIFLAVVWHQQPQHIKMTAKDVLQGWRLPWYLLADAWVVTLVLIRDLMGKRAGSYYRVCGFKTAREEPTLVGKRVLATVYASMSPNSIIVGIDWKQSRMLTHQIARSPVSRMTKNLGGQP